MVIDALMFRHCMELISKQAQWIRELPSADAKDMGERVADVSTLIQSLMEASNRIRPTEDHPGSQHEEDEILTSLFRDQPLGVYVDIGAGMPRECSNTWGLYCAGWSGLLVEPLPDFVLQLARFRPRDRVFPKAAAAHTGVIPLYCNGQVSSCTANWCAQDIDATIVECMTVRDILATDGLQQYLKADLCSIDVEGIEGEVLSGMPWDVFRPRVLCVEYRGYNTDSPGEDLSGAWEHIITEQGYVLHAKTEMNKIYVCQTPTGDVNVPQT